MNIPLLTDELFLSKFTNLALHGLKPMYDKHQNLFKYRIQNGHLVHMPMAWSLTYTAITILGLIRAHKNGWKEIPFNIGETLRSLVRESKSINRLGTLGLVLWADAHYEGEYKNNLLNLINKHVHKNTLLKVTTMDLAWLLTGLCYTQQQSGTNGDIQNLALISYETLVRNYNRATGLFKHTCLEEWSSGFRAQYGNFADQIYSVYAFTIFYRVFDQQEAINFALKCARKLCQLQGDQGQWWWHYHARRGVVASRYPIYSVHQDGMAPLALLELSKVSGQDFFPAVQCGLNWLFGTNELGLEIIDWNRNIVWRGIDRKYPIALLRYISMGLTRAGLISTSRFLDSIPGYRLIRELRPYHLGWILYALSGKQSLHI